MPAKAELFHAAGARLGEGPLWHPERQELFWFDILERRLHAADAAGRTVRCIRFDEAVSAAGIVDRDRLLIASESGLLLHDLSRNETIRVIDLEADRPATRSNDGRVGPHGIFWISTMGWHGGEAPGAGTIYGRKGDELRVLQGGLTIPNSICFAPDGRTAYFVDTPTNCIMHCALDPDTGWPTGPAEPFADTRAVPGSADGSVADAEGYLWNARWGGHCVARFAPDGRLTQIVEVEAENVTCPCFGGPDLTTLYITTARMDTDAPGAGDVYAYETGIRGQAETLVRL